MTNTEKALTDLIEHAQAIANNSDPLDVLRNLEGFELTLNDARRAAAADARAQGETWDAIGKAVHSSRQAAQQRYGDNS